jgi:hypothetical protein
MKEGRKEGKKERRREGSKPSSVKGIQISFVVVMSFTYIKSIILDENFYTSIFLFFLSFFYFYLLIGVNKTSMRCPHTICNRE